MINCEQGEFSLAKANEQKVIGLGGKITKPCSAIGAAQNQTNSNKQPVSSDCECGDLMVRCPSSATKFGEIMIFSASVAGEKGVTYKWEVDKGKIISG